MYNDDFCKYLKLDYNAQENDDYKNAKIFKIYSNTKDFVYIGRTCDTLNKYMSKFKVKSNARVNWAYDKFYMMMRQSAINCKIELIEDYPCNNEEELKTTKNEICVIN